MRDRSTRNVGVYELCFEQMEKSATFPTFLLIVFFGSGYTAQYTRDWLREKMAGLTLISVRTRRVTIGFMTQKGAIHRRLLKEGK